MVDCPRELRQRYAEGRLLPFLGAGMSMSVEWRDGNEVRRGPSWRELVDEAARQLGWADPDLLRARGTDLQILEYFRNHHHGRHERLSNWLVRSAHAPDTALYTSPIHKALRNLEKCSIFYTTNFDDYLERAFELLGRRTKVVAVEEEMATSGTGTEIVKFHGDVNHLDQMVLSESDYERRLALSTAMDYRFRGDVLGRAILFLGYSFRDYNVSYLFRLVAEQFLAFPSSPPSPRAYITVADPSKFEYELFAKRAIFVIPIRGAEMTEDIASLLVQIRS